LKTRVSKLTSVMASDNVVTGTDGRSLTGGAPRRSWDGYHARELPAVAVAAGWGRSSGPRRLSARSRRRRPRGGFGDRRRGPAAGMPYGGNESTRRQRLFGQTKRRTPLWLELMAKPRKMLSVSPSAEAAPHPRPHIIRARVFDGLCLGRFGLGTEHGDPFIESRRSWCLPVHDPRGPGSRPGVARADDGTGVGGPAKKRAQRR